MFQRIFFCTTGLVAFISGVYLLIAIALRLAVDYRMPQAPNAIFTVAFVLGYLLQGICWFQLGFSNKFWRSNADS